MAQFEVSELSAAAFAHPVRELRVIETHISWIVLTGRYAYKIKKPVRYDFLDAGTLERRRVLCHEELRLNRRLAARLYLDVVPIVREAGGLKVAADGPPVEYAVRMRQFDPAQELSARLARGEVTTGDMIALAAVLGEFHMHAAVADAASPFGGVECVRAQILDNTQVLRRHVKAAGERTMVRALDRWLQTSLAETAPLIAQRRHAARVRECHGDLHAGNIVRWRGAWVPFDCIEFSAELRFIDVMSDLAFLYMDLLARGRRDLGHVLLSAYLEITGDYAGLRLLTLFAVYRALVRAKIDALAAAAARGESSRTLLARRKDRIRVAGRLVRGRRPALVITHGVTGSGKSWLSERLVAVLPAVRIRSDLERKRLAGIGPLARTGSGVGEQLYAADITQQVYAHLERCADAALSGGWTVIVDAAFLHAADRGRFAQLASRRRCPFVILSCHADAETLRRRIDMRDRSGSDASEATLAVLEHQLATREGLAAEEHKRALSIDTRGQVRVDECAAGIRVRLANARRFAER
jgi:aminoglycoside phosphotransferase family enzyme/predicted kinase